MSFTFIDLFAGIGGIRLSFEDLGGVCLFTSEKDKYAQRMYLANFGELPAGDITNIDVKSIPNHDILLAGFPCQAFSIMGDRRGFEDTRGTLFFNVASILKEKSPYAFMLENVKHFKTHDKGRTFKTVISTLESLGYYIHTKVLNALDYGLPQKRERIIIVGFKENIAFNFPPPQPSSPPSLSSVLEVGNVPAKYYASTEIQAKRQAQTVDKTKITPSIWHENKTGNVSILPYSCALRAGASYNYLLVNGVRRLTPRELLRLQGFPETFKIVVSDQQIRKQTGNSVPVNMIKDVAKQVIRAINKREIRV